MSRFDGIFKASRPPASDSDKPLPKSKDPKYTRTTLYLPIEVHRKMKARAAEEGREMSDIMEELVKKWLGC